MIWEVIRKVEGHIRGYVSSIGIWRARFVTLAPSNDCIQASILIPGTMKFSICGTKSQFKIRLCASSVVLGLAYGVAFANLSRTASLFLPRHTHDICSRCVFRRDSLEKDYSNYTISLNSTTGTGRTGNVARNIWRAVVQAHACKGLLQLPLTDVFNAYAPSRSDSSLDFRSRDGPVHPLCTYPTHISGNLAAFNEWNSSFNAPVKYSNDISRIGDCLRNYFGFCKPGYCDNASSAKLGSLVAHVRNGDTFPQDFAPMPHVSMGQPPLSYYLSVLSSRPWSSVIIASEPGPRHNPVYDALLMLNATGTYRAVFQPERNMSWADDLQVLICAESIILNQSSLTSLLSLGFAKNLFYYSCGLPLVRDSGVYLFQSTWTGPYPPLSNHTNSAEEWVTMLLAKPASPAVVKCINELKSGA